MSPERNYDLPDGLDRLTQAIRDLDTRSAALDAVVNGLTTWVRDLDGRLASLEATLEEPELEPTPAPLGPLEPEPEPQPAPQLDMPFPGIRWYPTLGIRGGQTGWSGDAALVEDYYRKFAAPREARWFQRTPRNSWFLFEKKFRWKDALVDESLAPVSHEQARNPNWNNYKWNRVGLDAVQKMLTASVIAQDKAKLGLLVAMTATSEIDAVPQFMFDKGLAWREQSGHQHVRQDKEEGWRWMADFLVALVKRYGNEQGLGALIIGEYFPSSDVPADLDGAAFRTNQKKIWADVIANAPQDRSGNRCNIMQVNPILRGTGNQIKTADIADLGLGISSSDSYIFRECPVAGEPCEAGSVDRARQELHGVVPLHQQGDAAVFRSKQTAIWNGVDNPFGFGKGQWDLIQVPHIVWYYGSKGVVPLNSISFRDDPLLTDHWFTAFDRFGPGGTDAAAWGSLPSPG